MNEQEAIRKCRDGDRQAYGVLVRTVQRRALFSALRMLRCEAEAEDAVQVSLLRAFEGLEQFDPHRSFFPWFWVILKNECLKRIERRKREIPQDRLPERPVYSPIELKTEVNQALGKMTDNDRAILTLNHLEGRPYQEIASILDIPIGTVMSRLHAARARLRRILLEEP